MRIIAIRVQCSGRSARLVGVSASFAVRLVGSRCGARRSSSVTFGNRLARALRLSHSSTARPDCSSPRAAPPAPLPPRRSHAASRACGLRQALGTPKLRVELATFSRTSWLPYSNFFLVPPGFITTGCFKIILYFLILRNLSTL